MQCMLSGVAGLALAGGSYMCMTVSDAEQSKLRQSLSPELAEKYQQIVSERRNIYMQGLAIGTITAYFAQRSVSSTNMYQRAMTFVAVTLMISLIYYTLVPKSDYMLMHLKSSEQNQAWLEMYKTMKSRYMLGVVFGTLSAIPISLALCTSEQ